MNLLILFLTSFAGIFFKAFQQKNVNNNHYLAVLPISLCIVSCDVYIWGSVAVAALTNQMNWMFIVVMALGGGLGCLTSMWSHNKIFNEKRDGKEETRT